ncbi:MAG TPA: gamma carbonic anhydrase family protein [Acidobacteriota bacterium]|nr:gamma carbonic anhydrase family protein [Acidobacteriota bacterium]
MDDFGIVAKLEKPVIEAGAWVAPGVVLLGRVTVKRGASLWYGCVVRSDMTGAEIVVGEDSNIQDGTLVHVDKDIPCRIGARVSVGHGAILHACAVEDDALIAMGAILLNGCHIGKGSIVAAGAVVAEGFQVPPGVVVAGVPAKIRRETTEADRARLDKGWKAYAALRDLHKSGAR